MGIKNGKIKTIKDTDFLSQFGQGRGDFIKVGRKGGVAEILALFGNSFLETLARKLNDSGNIDTGEIIDSMKFTLKRFGRNYSFEFSLNEYYKFIDKDIKPGGKFAWDKSKGIDKDGKGNVLYQWVKRNNYSMSNGPKNKKQNQLSLAYLIGRKRQKVGRKGNRFFTNTVDDGRIQKLNKDLTKALKTEVTIDIMEFTKELKK
jgi:hypothetical protein